MLIEIKEAYDDAKKALNMWKTAGKELVNVLDRLSTAEANYKSIVAMVTSEKDTDGTSKAALKEIVKGDSRVLKAEAEVNMLKKYKESYNVRIDYLKAQYELEKKRMSAEMEEAGKMNFEEYGGN